MSAWARTARDAAWFLRQVAPALLPCGGRARIGYLIPSRPVAYDRAMASTRIRAYDVIGRFRGSPAFRVELYQPWNRYAACIFQKFFTPGARRKAARLKAAGSTVLLDVNVNYFDRYASARIRPVEPRWLRAFAEVADGFIAASPFLAGRARVVAPGKPVWCIPDSIADCFFESRRRHADDGPVRLLYVGYAAKACEVLLIRDVLERLGRDMPLEMVFLCERDPGLRFEHVTVRFVPYAQGRVAEDVRACDIKLAPRDLGDPYNRGHSFLKIGAPMAAGLPVAASPVDAYRGSPALLCETAEDWEAALRRLARDAGLRNRLGAEGAAYCRSRFSMEAVGRQYADLFGSVASGAVKA